MSFATALAGERTLNFPAEGAVRTALVIGAYCKANQPVAGAEATFEKFRRAYREGQELTAPAR